MALAECRECGKEVSNRAKTCPHCGVSRPGTTNSQMFGGAVIFIGMVIGGAAWMNSGPTVPAKATAAQQEAPALDEKRPVFVSNRGAILCPERMLLAAVTGSEHDRGELFLSVTGYRRAPADETRATPTPEAIAGGCQRIEPGTQLYDAQAAASYGSYVIVNIVAGKRYAGPNNYNAPGVPLWITERAYLTNSP
jgi:hypothetical protein